MPKNIYRINLICIVQLDNNMIEMQMIKLNEDNLYNQVMRETNIKDANENPQVGFSIIHPRI
jgi:hypothetical protein